MLITFSAPKEILHLYSLFFYCQIKEKAKQQILTFETLEPRNVYAWNKIETIGQLSNSSGLLFFWLPNQVIVETTATLPSKMSFIRS